MGLSVRTFMVAADNSVIKWSRAYLERLFNGDEAVPEFKNKRIRYAELVVENENGRAVAVTRIVTFVMFFDEEGRHKKSDHMRATVDAISVTAFGGDDRCHQPDKNVRFRRAVVNDDPRLGFVASYDDA